MSHRNKWVHKLRPYMEEYEKVSELYHQGKDLIGIHMTNDFNDGYEYEIFESEYGVLIGRRKDGKREVLLDL